MAFYSILAIKAQGVTEIHGAHSGEIQLRSSPGP